MRIVLAGYYGFRNIGDDLMLQNLLAVLSAKADVEQISVICREDYYQAQGKVRYLAGGKGSLPGRLLALARAHYVIWGGGTCLYESDDNSGLFWIERLQRLTHLFKGRFAFAGIGMGNFRSEPLAALAGKLLARADHISFREEESLHRAASLPGYRGNACSGGDLVFLDTAHFEALRRSRPERPQLGKISFSGLYGLELRQAAHYAAQLGSVAQELGAELHFLPAHAGAAGDNQFHRQVAKLLPNQEKCHFHDWQSPREYLQVMAAMDFHIGMRLHSIVCADLLGLPSLALSYAPKVRDYVEKSGMLAERRVIEMGAAFDATLVQEIAAAYRRPEYFIAQESQKANTCIKQMFL